MSIAVNIQSFSQERLVKCDVNVEKTFNRVFSMFLPFDMPVGTIKLKSFCYKKFQSCFDLCEQYFKHFYSNQYHSLTENQSANFRLAVPHFILSSNGNDEVSFNEITEFGIQESQVSIPYSSHLNLMNSERQYSIEELFIRHNCIHSYFDQLIFQGETTK